jgi:hypothetical protein
MQLPSPASGEGKGVRGFPSCKGLKVASQAPRKPYAGHDLTVPHAPRLACGPGGKAGRRSPCRSLLNEYDSLRRPVRGAAAVRFATDLGDQSC